MSSVEEIKRPQVLLRDHLDSLASELKYRVSVLKSYDAAYAINNYCEDLETEVNISTESAIEHLNKLREELLAEISGYRTELLQSLTCGSTTTMTTDDNNNNEEVMDNDKARTEHAEKRAELAEALKELSSEIDQFNAGCSAFFDHMGAATTTEIPSLINERAEQFRQRTAEMKKRLSSAAFQGRFMKYRVNAMFTIASEHLGRLEFSSEFHQKSLRSHELTLSPLRDELRRFDDTVSAMVIVDSETLVCGSADSAIYEMHDGRLNHKFDHTNPVLSMVALSDQLIASGAQDGSLVFFSADDDQDVRFVFEHKGAVFSLKALENGRVLASMSADDTIKIWEPSLPTERALVRTISGHGCTSTYSQLGVLSNGYLVTCSDDREDGLVRIWSPTSGRLAKMLSSGLGGVIALAVLSSDDIVVGSIDGSVRLVSLVDEALSRTFIGPREMNWTFCLAALPNDCVLVADSLKRPRLQIWDARSGELVQKLPTPHRSAVVAIEVNRRERRVATTSLDKSVQMWQWDLPQF